MRGARRDEAHGRRGRSRGRRSGPADKGALARSFEPGTVSLPIPQAAVEAATAISQPALDMLPAEAQEALKLLESMRHSTVVRNPPPPEVFEVQPMSVSDAIGRAVGS